MNNNGCFPPHCYEKNKANYPQIGSLYRQPIFGQKSAHKLRETVINVTCQGKHNKISVDFFPRVFSNFTGNSFAEDSS